MLADLQNSDFISWKENIIFLDNAWTDLYQEVINHGDKTFLKEISVSGPKILLPDDFYQLNYLCYKTGNIERPIYRKAKTGTGNGPYYDIINNEIVIYNYGANLGNIIVKYYPVRNGLTYPADTKNFAQNNADLEIGNIIDVCNQYVLSANGVFDIINATKVSSDTGWLLYDNVLTISDTTNKYFKVDNRLYTYQFDNGVFTLYKYFNGSTKKYAVIDTITTAVADNIPAGRINTFTEDGIYYVDGTDLHFISFSNGNDTIFTNNIASNNVVSFNGSIYYETLDGICRDDTLVVPSDNYFHFNGVMKVDLDTGYGILTDNVTLRSAFENTELDYPSNFYFNYLAYKLAIYYKNKQNADPSALLMQLADATKTFYDTLPRDENEFVRISNVYAY